MDLRPYNLTPAQVEQAIGFIRQYLLYYQPYIITDTLEVGEGQNFNDGYDRKDIYRASIYSDRDLNLGIPQAKNLEHFRRCNADYRKFYDSFADQIVAHFGAEFKDLTFSEIGTNSGLHLFNLAKRGARRCMGYDWNDMGPLFKWMNGILGTNVEFTKAIWNRYYHRLDGMEHPEVDVMISSVVLNHQIDFLAHLAYLCDRAKRAIFLWVQTEHSDATDGVDAAWDYKASKQYFISVCEPNALHPLVKQDWEGNPFPICFDHGITISDPLLKRSLQYLGFETILPLKNPEVGEGWKPYTNGFKPYLAVRTRNTKSGYWHTRHENAPGTRPTQQPILLSSAKRLLRRLAA